MNTFVIKFIDKCKRGIQSLCFTNRNKSKLFESKYEMPEFWDSNVNKWIITFQYLDDLYYQNLPIPSKFYIPPSNKNRLTFIQNELSLVRKHKISILLHNLAHNKINMNDYNTILKKFDDYSNHILKIEKENYEDCTCCIICFEYLTIDCVIYPCNHTGVCHQCIIQLNECPLCRKQIEQFILC